MEPSNLANPPVEGRAVALSPVAASGVPTSTQAANERRENVPGFDNADSSAIPGNAGVIPREPEARLQPGANYGAKTYNASDVDPRYGTQGAERPGINEQLKTYLSKDGDKTQTTHDHDSLGAVNAASVNPASGGAGTTPAVYGGEDIRSTPTTTTTTATEVNYGREGYIANSAASGTGSEASEAVTPSGNVQAVTVAVYETDRYVAPTMPVRSIHHIADKYAHPAYAKEDRDGSGHSEEPHEDATATVVVPETSAGNGKPKKHGLGHLLAPGRATATEGHATVKTI